jgi:hypothetical protein
MNNFFPHKTTGTIKYDPPRPGMKRKTEGWCVLDIDREITRHLRWWVKTKYHLDLIPPAWDAHVSIFRGEKYASNKHLWKKYHGKKIEIEYSHFIRQTGDTKPGSHRFFFVDVKSPFITEMRNEMGLKSDWNQHITFGKLPDNWDDVLYIKNDKRLRND